LKHALTSVSVPQLLIYKIQTLSVGSDKLVVWTNCKFSQWVSYWLSGRFHGIWQDYWAN